MERARPRLDLVGTVHGLTIPSRQQAWSCHASYSWFVCRTASISLLSLDDGFLLNLSSSTVAVTNNSSRTLTPHHMSKTKPLTTNRAGIVSFQRLSKPYHRASVGDESIIFPLWLHVREVVDFYLGVNSDERCVFDSRNRVHTCCMAEKS